MKAMILAAGLGTRLRPITNTIPKALVEINGIPILQHVIMRLKKQGFDYIVINIHHFADKIKDFLSSHNFGLEIQISEEYDELLDTGGGIIKAKNLLFKNDTSPFLVHNVDILSNADLAWVVRENRGGATLLVSNRKSSRKLIFNSDMRLRGWHDLKNNLYRPEGLQPDPSDIELAFSGIYSMSKEGVEEMEILLGKGKFSVIEYFLNHSRRQEIFGISCPHLSIIDIGKPSSLSQAPAFL